MPPPTVPPIVYKNGQTESLTFPELDIFELVQFADFLVEGRTPELVMLCAHRKPEWLRSITVGTFTALARYFINRNFTLAMEIATGDPIAGMKMGGLLTKMAAFERSAPSTNSAPTLASAAPNGSDSPIAPAPAAAAAETTAAPAATPPPSSSAS